MSEIERALGNIGTSADGRPWRDRVIKQAVDALPDSPEKWIFQEMHFALKLTQEKFLQIFLATKDFPGDATFARMPGRPDPSLPEDESPAALQRRYDALFDYTMRLEQTVAELYEQRRAELLR